VQLVFARGVKGETMKGAFDERLKPTLNGTKEMAAFQKYFDGLTLEKGQRLRSVMMPISVLVPLWPATVCLGGWDTACALGKETKGHSVLPGSPQIPLSCFLNVIASETCSYPTQGKPAP